MVVLVFATTNDSFLQSLNTIQNHALKLCVRTYRQALLTEFKPFLLRYYFNILSTNTPYNKIIEFVETFFIKSYYTASMIAPLTQCFLFYLLKRK